MEDLLALEDFDAYCRLFTSLELWAPYARQACLRHNLAPCERVRVGVPGTYPAFLVEDRWVVKFFGRLFDGGRSFLVEREAARLARALPQVQTARVLASGELGGEGWPWPYLIFEMVQGASIGEVMDGVSEEDRLRVAREMGAMAAGLHQIPLQGQEVFPDSWMPFLQFLEDRRRACVEDHAAWGALPAGLVEQIEGYLPPVERLVDRSRPPHLIHGDLTRDHLLGRMDGGRWNSLALIDFGDAMTGSLWYELAALHLDLFGGEKEQLAAFIHAYAEAFPQVLALARVGGGAEGSFAHLALSAALLHRFNVLACLQENKLQARSLEDLASSLWDISALVA